MIDSPSLHQILPIREQLPTLVARRRQWKTPLRRANFLVLVAYSPIQNTWRLQRQKRKFSKTSDEVRAQFFCEFRFSVARIVISDPKCTELGGESMWFRKKCKNGSAYWWVVFRVAWERGWRCVRLTQGGSKSSRICLAIPCLRHRGIARGHLRVEDMENSTTFDADCGAIWGSHKYNLCANMLTDTSCRHIWGQNIIERPYFGSVRHLVRHYHQSLRVGYYGSGMD